MTSPVQPSRVLVASSCRVRKSRSISSSSSTINDTTTNCTEAIRCPLIMTSTTTHAIKRNYQALRSTRNHHYAPVFNSAILRPSSAMSSMVPKPPIRSQERSAATAATTLSTPYPPAIAISRSFIKKNQNAGNFPSGMDLVTPRMLLAATSAATALAFAWNFVTAATTTSGAETTATTTSTVIGRGSGGGGGNGGGGPSLKTTYPTVVSKKKAEEDVRQWEKDTVKDSYEVSQSAVQGARWTMEDAFTVANGGHFTAVYDGHGGSDVSGMLRDRVHRLYTENLSKRHFDENDQMGSRTVPYTSSIPSIQSHISAIKTALNRVERDVLELDDLEYQGSTAVVVIVHEDEEGERTLVSANIGDSRAILCREGKAVDLTKDHKPSEEREKARIRAMGADVEWDPYGQLYRVKDLSLSRAIGDRFAKPVVSSEAEVDCITLVDDKDEFLVLASDGLWDVMTSQEVVDFVYSTLKDPSGVQTSNGKIMLSPELRKKKMARIIANEALERGSADNVCVILVWLQKDK